MSAAGGAVTTFDAEVWRGQFIALMRIGYREGVLGAVFPADAVKAVDAALAKHVEAKNWRVDMLRQLERAIVDFGAACVRDERALATYLAACAALHAEQEAG